MAEDLTALPRLATGVPGLDRVLQGGLFESSVYMVVGPPGAGKTILGNQVCYHHASQGAQVVYLTLLAESHARMLAHLRGMSFFRPDLVANNVHYVSGFKVLENDGLFGLLRVIRETVAPKKASVLVIDGLVSVVLAAPGERDYRKFIHELQALAAMTGCTVLLLASSEESDTTRPEHTMVDGIIELTDEVQMLRSLRHLQIQKLRGTGPVRGKHTISITADGITLLPRLEAQLLRLPEDARLPPGKARVAFGLPELDQMLGGGIPACSTTMLLGPTGAGKTLLSLQFLAAGAAQGERGLFFGFYERPHTLVQKSQRIGLDLELDDRGGLTHFAWEAFGEASIDIVGQRLMSLIREHKPKRLIIDGMQGFQQAVDFPERLQAVLSALVDDLEAHHITTLYTVESREIYEALVHAPISGISAVTHNIIMLRHQEKDARVKKLLSVLKLRDSGFDPSVRELRITDTGIVVDPGPEGSASARGAEASHTAGPEPRRADGTPRTSSTQPRSFILIVDDEFGLAELISEVLEEKGYSTAIAINGELGLALMRERRPDLVLMDLMMPVLNGHEMMRRMRAEPDYAGVPVVVMTALPEAVSAEQSASYAAVLQKPFTPDRLFEVVRASIVHQPGHR